MKAITVIKALNLCAKPILWPAFELWRQRFRPAWLTECLWHGLAVRALEQSNRNYRKVATSNTTAGLLAAASAGLAVTATMSIADLPAGLRAVRPDEDLPPLPEVSILLLKLRDVSQPMTDILANLIQELSAQKT